MKPCLSVSLCSSKLQGSADAETTSGRDAKEKLGKGLFSWVSFQFNFQMKPSAEFSISYVVSYESSHSIIELA